VTLPERVTVVEVGPRDGLQNEKGFVPTEAKVAFVEALADAGLPVVETTAFVSPKAIPQLADSAEVFSRVRKRPGTCYPVLVPNERGMARALAAGAREIALFTAATDTFNLRNTNATVEQSFSRFAPVVALARREGVRVRGYVSTVFGCPYEGKVDPSRGFAVALRLFEAGCEEVSLGDTIGVAVPSQVADVVGRLRAAGADVARLALHMHDTRGTALANVVERLRGRPRGLPLRSRRSREPLHGGPPLPARRDGLRDGSRSPAGGRGDANPRGDDRTHARLEGLRGGPGRTGERRMNARRRGRRVDPSPSGT
jgi:isopropylmalate/homocitrate/citramalate synthase